MPSPRHNRLQFSLRTFLLFALLCVIPAAHVGKKRYEAAKEEAALQALLATGARIQYSNDRGPTRPQWLTFLYGRDVTGDHAHLFLDSAAVTEKDLMRLEGLPRVELLTLGPGVSDKAMIHVARMKGLKWLNLTKANISNRGLKSIAQMRGLEELYICGPQFDDDSLRAIGAMNLKKLSIAQSSISDNGLWHLRGMPLESLYIGETAVSDAGMVHLTTGGALKHINLSNTPKITLEGERTLRKAYGAELWIEDPIRHPGWY